MKGTLGEPTYGGTMMYHIDDLLHVRLFDSNREGMGWVNLKFCLNMLVMFTSKFWPSLPTLGDTEHNFLSDQCCDEYLMVTMSRPSRKNITFRLKY